MYRSETCNWAQAAALPTSWKPLHGFQTTPGVRFPIAVNSSFQPLTQQLWFTSSCFWMLTTSIGSRPRPHFTDPVGSNRPKLDRINTRSEPEAEWRQIRMKIVLIETWLPQLKVVAVAQSTQCLVSVQVPRHLRALPHRWPLYRNRVSTRVRIPEPNLSNHSVN